MIVFGELGLIELVHGNLIIPQRAMIYNLSFIRREVFGKQDIENRNLSSPNVVTFLHRSK